MTRTTVATLAALAFAASCAHTRQDLSMTVVFEDPGDLTVGNDVRMGKSAVGEVRQLRKADDGIEVEIVVRSDHRNRVTDDAEFRIKKAGLIGGDAYVEIEPGSGDPLGNGARARGIEGLMSRALRWAKGLYAWLENPRLREQAEALDKAAHAAAEDGRDAWERQESLLRERADRLVELAREEAPEVADRVRKVVNEMLDELAAATRKRR